MKIFKPGDRVMVYDYRFFVDDISTPPSSCIKSATVIRWYGYRSERFGEYPSLIDVQFDHEDFVSHGHFTDHVEKGESTMTDDFTVRVLSLVAGAAVLYYLVLPVLIQSRAAVIQALSLIGGGR